MQEVRLGKYRHFKGGLYEVIGTARHSETLEKLVVYKNLYDHPKYGRGSIWVRPKEIFLEQVEVDSKKVPRFKFIEKI